ncbi:hypothetical protein LZ31DRAFT_106789 [Colletotrichum somersetense]|nr:hypothetical protein LZ31DRAFT_106789 [Colletotrichum somersetense]
MEEGRGPAPALFAARLMRCLQACLLTSADWVCSVTRPRFAREHVGGGLVCLPGKHARDPVFQSLAFDEGGRVAETASSPPWHPIVACWYEPKRSEPPPPPPLFFFFTWRLGHVGSCLRHGCQTERAWNLSHTPSRMPVCLQRRNTGPGLDPAGRFLPERRSDAAATTSRTDPT